MDVSIRVALLFIAALLTGVQAASAADRLEPVDEFVPLQAIAKFKDDASAAREELEGAEMLSIGPGVWVVRLQDEALHMLDPADVAAKTWGLIERLQARDDVEYAHTNRLISVASTPNDPHYNLQWNLQVIGWSWTPSMGMLGSPSVRIAIIDTGSTDHPDLAGRWVASYNSAHPIDSCVLGGGSSPVDGGRWRHGSHVASVIGASTDNATGVAGICPGCSLMAVKARCDNQYGGQLNTAAIIAGIYWAVGNGADVINLSLEQDEDCTEPGANAIRDAIQHAVYSGVHVVAAAGNQASPAGGTWPASCPGVISVAAIDRNDGASYYSTLAPYTNYGDSSFDVTLAAPGGGGVMTDWDPNSTNSARGAGIGCPADSDSYFSDSTLGVVGAWRTAPLSGNVDCYRYLSGTSIAAAHVSGVIGLMQSVNPQLTPQQVHHILTGTAEPLMACYGSKRCGAGLLKADTAVTTASSGSGSLPNCTTDPDPDFCP